MFELKVVNFINILGAAFVTIFLHKKLQSRTVTREKMRKALLYKKGTCKMLMKLTQGRKYSLEMT